jgi:hypothetical protein
MRLHIFILFFPKIPFFVQKKRPKNALSTPKRDGKGVFFSKKGRKIANGMQIDLWIFNNYSVKKSHQSSQSSQSRGDPCGRPFVRVVRVVG